jgi:hypothetical protein
MEVELDLASRLMPDLVARVGLDDRAAVEAATGELGSKPDALKLAWLQMRTKEEPRTKQRFSGAVARALAKLRRWFRRRRLPTPIIDGAVLGSDQRMQLIVSDSSPSGRTVQLQLAAAVDDEPVGEVVWRDSDRYPIARYDFDVKPSQATTNASEKGVPLVALNAKMATGQGFNHLTLNLNEIVSCHSKPFCRVPLWRSHRKREPSVPRAGAIQDRGSNGGEKRRDSYTNGTSVCRYVNARRSFLDGCLLRTYGALHSEGREDSWGRSSSSTAKAADSRPVTCASAGDERAGRDSGVVSVCARRASASPSWI